MKKIFARHKRKGNQQPTANLESPAPDFPFILKYSLLFFSFLLFAIDAQAQCQIHNLDTPNGAGTTTCAANQPSGQTFTACQDGSITSISVSFRVDGSNSPQAGNYELYLGADPGSLTPLPTTPVSTVVVGVAPINGQPLVFNLSVPFPVLNDGTLYRFEATNTTGSSAFDFIGSDYPDGVFTNHASSHVSDFDLDFEIQIAVAAAAVPTLGEWGLILLALLLLVFGLASLHAPAPKMAMAGGQSYDRALRLKNWPFDKGLYIRLLPLVALGVLAAFGAAVFAFGYRWTGADPFGILVSVPLVSYLVMLLMLEK